MGITVFQQVNMDSTDVVDYLKLMGDEDNDDLISRWGEDIAYDLYLDNQYLHLNGYILYYIYEVVTGNMKMHHFNQLEGRVGLKYFNPQEDVVSNYNQQRGTILTRNVELTTRRDMRKSGGVHFEDFITYYIRGMVHAMTEDVLTENSMVHAFTKMDRIEYALQFAYFAVKEEMGVLSEERYTYIKEKALGYIQKEVDRVQQDKSRRFIQRGSYIISTMEKLYKQTERL